VYERLCAARERGVRGGECGGGTPFSMATLMKRTLLSLSALVHTLDSSGETPMPEVADMMSKRADRQELA
jgi:hypothetical protein